MGLGDGFNQVYIDNGGSPEKWASNGVGAGKVSLYKPDGSAYSAGDEATSLPVVGNYRAEEGSGSSPTMGDIVRVGSGAALDATYFQIRTTSGRDIRIPMAVAGYRYCAIGMKPSAAFDEDVQISLYAHGSNLAITTYGLSLLMRTTLEAGDNWYWIISSQAASSVGGVQGGDPISNTAHFGVPAMLGSAALVLRLQGKTAAPTAGDMNISITRV